MTEKIIIDGVNVAGCNFYVKHCIEDCYDERVDLYEYCQMFGSECTNEKDCYYKQLKRLEQENKELKSDVLKWQKAFSRQYQINENKGYSKAEEKYRSALEEINTLAKNYCNACDEFKVKTYKNKNDCLYCNYGFIKRKIKEVLNEH